MKQKMYALWLGLWAMTLMLTLCPAALQAHPGQGDYTVGRGKAYYRGRMISGAHAASFEILGYGYAKDRYRVYMDGKVLPHVDPRSFRLLTRHEESHRPRPYANDHKGQAGYYTDAYSVYYDGKRMTGAAVNSFAVLGEGYAKDAYSVYYRGEKIKNAVANSFRQTGNGYAHDAFNTYYRGKRVSR